MKSKWVLKILYPLLALLLFVGVWAIAAACVGVEIILPAPLAALRRFFGLFGEGAFWIGMGYSVLRTLAGFLFSFLSALLLAVSARLWNPLARFLAPIVTILRSMPTISVIFMSMVFLPAGQVPVLISFLIVFPMLYNGFFEALQGVDPELAEMSRLYRVPRRVQLTRFYIPAILPEVFGVSRSAIGLNLKTVVAAEAIASTRMSLGQLLQNASAYLDSAGLFAYTVMAVLVSFLLEGAVLLLRRRVVRWR